MDCNPEGIMIFLTYRQGSIRTSIEGSQFGTVGHIFCESCYLRYVSVVHLHWLGLRPTQVLDHEEKYKIGRSGESFTTRDKSLVETIRRRLRALNCLGQYEKELVTMEKEGKYELQWLYGHPQGLSYLSSTFVPRAIMRQDFL